MNSQPRKSKMETQLYKWFAKRFSGSYFNFTPKRRDKYLQSCAKELDKAIKDVVRERVREDRLRNRGFSGHKHTKRYWER